MEIYRLLIKGVGQSYGFYFLHMLGPNQILQSHNHTPMRDPRWAPQRGAQGEIHVHIVLRIMIVHDTYSK